MLIMGKDGKQYNVNSVNDLPDEAKWDSNFHHPQTAQAVDNATNSSPTRNDASKPSEGNPKNQAPNNAGSNTDPDNGKPDGKPKVGTSKPKSSTEDGKKNVKRVLNRENNLAESAYQNRTRRREKTIAGMGRRGSIGAFGFLGAVFDGVGTYKAEREEDPNGSKVGDLAKATAVGAGWLYASGLMWSLAGVKGAVAIGTELYEDANRNYQAEKSQSLHITQDASGNTKGTLGGQLIDSETAYTMRQRSEQVMRQHKIATESILGSEARQLHR